MLVVAACEMAQSPVRRDRAVGAVQGARAANQLWLGYCASCHGVRGEGTPVAMVRLDAAWQGQRSDSLIRARIMYGVPGTTMAPWGRALSREEVERLVGYVRGIGR